MGDQPANVGQEPVTLAAKKTWLLSQLALMLFIMVVVNCTVTYYDGLIDFGLVYVLLHTAGA